MGVRDGGCGACAQAGEEGGFEVGWFEVVGDAELADEGVGVGWGGVELRLPDDF